MGNLQTDSKYDKEEIENIFDHGFGYQIRGINRITGDDGSLECILVFSKDDGPYSDAVKGGEFTYWGELQNGEHNTAYNKGLVKAITEDIPVHFFHQEDSAEWEYLGEVDVVGVKETKDNKGRTNYRFSFELME